MEIPFFKYQGTGNDFVITDNRLELFPKNDTKLVAKICDRKFGIGADGLILLEESTMSDFKMVYYNADGNLSSMCGNGGRCVIHFAQYLEIINEKATFEAVDGLHTATITGNLVSLRMNDVHKVEKGENHLFLDTGSPHHVEMVENLSDFDVKTKGAAIRYNTYGSTGANVNFVEKMENDIFSVRTYERGVENETLSCGTGVTAVAIAMYEGGLTTSNNIMLKTPGGELNVCFTESENGYEQIFLKGPAVQVFKGVYR